MKSLSTKMHAFSSSRIVPACSAATRPVTAPTSSIKRSKLDIARMLYEDVWSGGRIRLLNEIMAEHHIQRDIIWQPDNTGGGRDRMKRGVLAFRKAYPDLRFKVEDLALCEASGNVFISWDASGTNLGPIHTQAPSGKAVTFSGITYLVFDEEGRILESRVFRQAPKDEAAYFTENPAADGSPH